MELTQRLECTQELYPAQSEKEFPDQIGFLGICGTKYPVRKGPNKIGRDPDTCNILLNLNSISRQHAVINILNNHEFMLMDLDSANKTKISNQTLQAYIPHPLKNGDMVQFGNVFGVFRLIEEDNDLPMTQAIDVPETPVQKRYMSRVNAHATMVPESPDVSDKDESFIAPSQPKPKDVFKSPSNNFIKTSGKTISIKPVGLNKIDNVYWSSSKKSDSFSLQSNSSVNESVDNQKTIHEMETQVENHNESKDSIYNANTQFENLQSPSVHCMETQILTDLPEVRKFQDQNDLNFNFSTDNKENDNNIFNAETQALFEIKETGNCSDTNIVSNELSIKDSKENLDDSNEIILFDEIDTVPLEDNFESQALLPQEIDIPKVMYESQEIGYRKKTRVQRLKSDSSTDCEDIDIAMTQKIQKIDTKDDDLTDCEDELIVKLTEPEVIDDDVTDCEDDIDDIIKPNKPRKNDQELIENNTAKSNVKTVNIDDLPTQVIEVAGHSKSADSITAFEDLPTQIIYEEIDNKPVCLEEALTQQIYSQEIVTPFKMPRISPHLRKKNVVSDLKIVQQIVNNDVSNGEDDEKYYAATQQIFNDLCTQREPSPEIILPTKTPTKCNTSIRNNISKSSGNNSDDSDMEEKINNFVTSLSNSQIKDVVGVATAKSQSPIIQTLSLSRKKKPGKEKNKSNTEIDLSKESEDKTLPSRIMTRIRKPTMKMQNCDEATKELCDKIINPQNTGQIIGATDNVKNSKQKELIKSKTKPEEKKSNISKKRMKDEKKEDETRRSKKSKDKKEPAKSKEKPTKDILYYLNKNDTTRKTRSRSNQKDEKYETKESTTRTSDIKTRGRQKEKEKQEISPKKEVRRSRRQGSSQKAEKGKEVRETKSPNISKGSLEQSTVYNNSDSSIEAKLKRPASNDYEAPIAKKPRGRNSNNVSKRTTTAKKLKHYVLFTAFPCEEVKVKLENLGAIIVSDVTKCTVVLTMQIKRTFKLLCAVGLGKPIVGPSWVQACVDTNTIVDPWQYLIQDETTENRFQFNLSRSLSTRRGFLSGYNISSTPSVLPSAQEMKLIVECSGGTWKEQGPNWICVSAIPDKALWPTLKKRGAVIVSTEFILAGVLRQKVEIDVNKLT